MRPLHLSHTLLLALPLTAGGTLAQTRAVGPLDRRDPDSGLTIRNLGGPVGIFSVDRRRVAYTLHETALGTDLNGDGDTSDFVPFLHTFATDETVGLATSAIHLLKLRLNGPLLVYLVSESEEEADLNGDGDQHDLVVHVHDERTSVVTSTELAIDLLTDQRNRIALDGELVAFLVNEAQQSEDLNADGVVSSLTEVVCVYDAADRQVTNTGLTAARWFDDAVPPDPLLVDGLAALLVDEVGSDLNADGDLLDAVVHLFDTADGSVTNVGVSGIVAHLDRDAVLIEVSEKAQGGVDLSGDGDSDDWVLHRYDIGMASLTNLGLTVYPADSHCDPSGKIQCDLATRCVVAAGHAWFWVREGDGLGDQNGDGDASDEVLVQVELATGQAVPIPIAALAPQPRADVLAFLVREDQEGADLNGDGDMLDRVLHVLDGSGMHSVGLATASFQLGSWTTVAVPEAQQGGLDLNGDGDASDFIQFVLDDTLTARNLGVSGGGSPVGDWVLLRVNESASGAVDLNGDGDTSDPAVVHVFDGRHGHTANLGIASTGVQVSDRAAAFGAFETLNGVDFSGDGDTNDYVLFVVGRF